MNKQISEKDLALLELISKLMVGLENAYVPKNTMARIQEVFEKFEKLCYCPMSSKHYGDFSHPPTQEEIVRMPTSQPPSERGSTRPDLDL